MAGFRKWAMAVSIAGALALPGVAAAQGWSGGYGDGDGRRGGYGQDRNGQDRNGQDRVGQDRSGNWERGRDRDQGGRGDWNDGRRADDERRGGRDYDRRGWDGEGRRPGWGGAGPAGSRWWRGRWWSYGAGPCWRWSQWRQNWKWVCD